MVIHSLYPSDIPVDPGVNGASVRQNGDFSVLLLLVLAAALPQNAPARETAGSSSASVANQSTNADPFSNSGARISGANNHGNASNVAEKSLAESNGVVLLPDVQLLEGISRQPEATIGQIENLPTMIPLGEEGTGVSASVPRDLGPRSEHPFFEADRFDETTKAKGATPGAPKDLPEEFSNGLTERDLLLKDHDQYKPGAEILLDPVPIDDDVIAGNLKIQPREMHTLFGSYSASANQASDYRILQSARELEGGREPNKKFTGSRDTGSKLLQQSRLHAESELSSSAMPGNVERVGEFRSPDAHPQEQGFSSQNNGSDGSHEVLQMAVETSVETAPSGAVIQVAHTWEKILKTEPRESQNIEWRPVIDRVVDEIGGRIRIGGREAVLQLDPPELGRLRIDLHMDGDKLAARILTETQESRTLLETHLPELRQALGEIRVELVDVRIDSGSWSGPRGDGQQEPRHEANSGRQTADNFNHPVRSSSEELEAARRTSSILDVGSVSMWA
jgi:hypothetical protein